MSNSHSLSPELLENLRATLDATLRASDPHSDIAVRLRAAAERLAMSEVRVLISGLRSVGKSSLVCALWGDAGLLPTAERDCTQTNTLIRAPGSGEADPQINLAYLTRDAAISYALRGPAHYRIHQFLAETLGPAALRIDEGSGEAQLRAAVSALRRLFSEQPALSVLHESLTDDAQEIEQFLSFIDSAEFHSGQRVPARWEDRREHLMGKRHPDGRTVDVGPLLALHHVEVVRTPQHWHATPPQLIDTPWIPAFHNARRADLILDQARKADILIVVSRPDVLEPEEWLLKLFHEQPDAARRTLVVFNQIDTVDTLALFSRDGFATHFERNVKRLGQCGIRPENILATCARLPFLELLAADIANVPPGTTERIARLRRRLEQIEKLLAARAQTPFTQLVLRACDPASAGLDALRERILEMAAGPVLETRVGATLDAIQNAAMGSAGADWDEIRKSLNELRRLPRCV